MNWRLLIFLLIAPSCFATTRYIAQSAGVISSSDECNGQTAITPATFSGITNAGDDLDWLCETITASANSTGISVTGSGSSGHPITIKFATGAILQAPYFASSVGGTQAGGITLKNGQSYIVIDGNNLGGTVQNTANGSSLANQQSSTAISAFTCSNCTVKNLNIVNVYVNVTGNSTIADSSVVRAIDFTGSNWTISGNVIHDCGWCLVEFTGSGNDSTISIFNNNIYNMAHGWALAPASGHNVSSLFFYNNHVHDALNWQAPGCFAHIDGIHAFGTPSTTTIDQVYVYNNLFDGDWGTCPTGFIFVEGGGSTTPANMLNSAWWNNVFVVVNSGFVDTQGWFGLFSGNSGTQQVLSNTFVAQNGTDNTACFHFSGQTGTNMAALTFEDNTTSPCGNPISIDSTVTVSTIDYNAYGPFGSNAFSWHGTTGSFATWKTNCSCDSHGLQNNTMNLNAQGAPNSGSPVISAGLNLSSSATGNLATLQNDTTLGGSRSTLSRPGGITAWDIGAFQFASGIALSLQGTVIQGARNY